MAAPRKPLAVHRSAGPAHQPCRCADIKALLIALREAVDFINKDRTAAAQIYLDSLGGKGETLEEAVASLDDPRNVITMVPQNTLKYAQFMNEIGSLKNRAESWKDLFFPEIHDLPGC